MLMSILLSTALAWGAEPAKPADAPAKTYQIKEYKGIHKRGLVRSKKSKEFLLKAPHVQLKGSTGTPIPSKYSLRGKAGPVEDQGQCGSCWDFSLTSALRGTLILAGKDPGRLSFNYLLNCETQDAGCNGGDFNAAQMMVTPQGPPSYGLDGPYTATDGACIQKPVKASAIRYLLLGSEVGGSASFSQIAYVVGIWHRPVVVDIAADNNWENYAGGVYNGCSDENQSDINHMVVIEGYDCETAVDSTGHCKFDAHGNLPHGVGTWLIRNSWGTSWGDAGYITMKATDPNGLQCNAVAVDALYYTVAKPVLAKAKLKAAKPAAVAKAKVDRP